MSEKYTLPIAENARNIVATPLERASQTLSTIPRVQNTLEINLPKNVGTVRVDNSKFLNTLSQINRPIDRLQNLASSTSSRLRSAVDNIIPISPYQLSISNTIQSKLQNATRISANIGGSTITAQLSGGYVDKIMEIPNKLGQISSLSSMATTMAGLSALNSSISMSAKSTSLCGSVANMLKSAIDGLCGFALQMQRTVLAKLDSLATEILDVIEKKFGEILALIPEVNIEWPIKKIEEKLRSVLSAISKITPIINRILQEAADCENLVNTAIGMATLGESLFGKEAVSSLPGLQDLYTSNNLGKIGNVNLYLQENYPQTTIPITATVTATNINSDGFTGTIQQGEGTVNLGENKQNTTFDGDLNVGEGNITGSVINYGSGSTSGIKDPNNNEENTEEDNTIPVATIEKGTINNGIVENGVIKIPLGGSISGSDLLDEDGNLLNKKGTGSVLDSSDERKDLSDGTITDGKITEGTISIIGIEESAVNLDNVTIVVKNHVTTIITSTSDVYEITSSNQIIINNVVISVSNLEIVILQGNIEKVEITNVKINITNEEESCGSQVISGTKEIEISTNSLRPTVQEQVNNNREGLILETIMAGNDSKSSANEIKNDIINIALEETMNPELQDSVDSLTQYSFPTLEEMKENLSNISKEINEKYKDALETIYSGGEPDPFASSIKKVLDEIEELDNELEEIYSLIKDLDDNLIAENNKLITNNMNTLLDCIDDVKDEIDENINDQLKDIDMIFKALDREAQLVDQKSPTVSEKTKDDSCQLEYRVFTNNQS